MKAIQAVVVPNAGANGAVAAVAAGSARLSGCGESFLNVLKEASASSGQDTEPGCGEEDAAAIRGAGDARDDDQRGAGASEAAAAGFVQVQLSLASAAAAAAAVGCGVADGEGACVGGAGADGGHDSAGRVGGVAGVTGVSGMSGATGAAGVSAANATSQMHSAQEPVVAGASPAGAAGLAMAWPGSSPDPQVSALADGAVDGVVDGWAAARGPAVTAGARAGGQGAMAAAVHQEAPPVVQPSSPTWTRASSIGGPTAALQAEPGVSPRRDAPWNMTTATAEPGAKASGAVEAGPMAGGPLEAAALRGKQIGAADALRAGAGMEMPAEWGIDTAECTPDLYGPVCEDGEEDGVAEDGGADRIRPASMEPEGRGHAQPPPLVAAARAAESDSRLRAGADESELKGEPRANNGGAAEFDDERGVADAAQEEQDGSPAVASGAWGSLLGVDAAALDGATSGDPASVASESAGMPRTAQPSAAAGQPDSASPAYRRPIDGGLLSTWADPEGTLTAAEVAEAMAVDAGMVSITRQSRGTDGNPSARSQRRAAAADTVTDNPIRAGLSRTEPAAKAEVKTGAGAANRAMAGTRLSSSADVIARERVLPYAAEPVHATDARAGAVRVGEVRVEQVRAEQPQQAEDPGSGDRAGAALEPYHGVGVGAIAAVRAVPDVSAVDVIDAAAADAAGSGAAQVETPRLYVNRPRSEGSDALASPSRGTESPTMKGPTVDSKEPGAGTRVAAQASATRAAGTAGTGVAGALAAPVVAAPADNLIIAERGLSPEVGKSVLNQIAAHVQARAARGGGEFRAKLVPENLGEVEIRVRMAGDSCITSIRVEDSEVGKYIELHGTDLKVTLAENGIDLGGLAVSVGSDSTMGNGGGAQHQFAQSPFADGRYPLGQDAHAGTDRSARKREKAGPGFGRNSDHYVTYTGRGRIDYIA